jgi:serine/threonine protein phosphatase 1
MFAHAGINPERPLTRQRPEDLRWIREAFLTHRDLYGKVIVHGHTITESWEFHPNRIGVDTGAYFSGQLTCLVLQGDKREILHTRR